MQHIGISNSLLSIALILSTFLVSAPATSSDWPAGIPKPNFDPDMAAPEIPSNWDGNLPGFYYLRQDGNNNGNGYPANPSSSMPSTISEGSVIVIDGDFSSPGYTSIQFNGTPEKPIWVLAAAGKDAAITDEWVVKGSWVYFVGMNGKWSNGSGGRLTVGNAGIHHLVIRGGDFRGDTGDGVGGISGGNMNNVVIKDNIIHHNGTVPPSYDQDNHGIVLGNGSSDVWIINNSFEANSGNAVQVNGNTNSDVNRIFIAGNYVANNYQAAFGIKQSTDVVISDNVVTNKVGSGDCIVIQYGPEYVWVIRNQVSNCDGGIRIASDSGGTGTEHFIVGNLIFDVDGGSNFSPSNAWASSAIGIWGGTNTRIINNTIWNAAGGIYSPRKNGGIDMVNNLFGKISSVEGRSIFFESTTTFRNSDVVANLYATVDGRSHLFRVGTTNYSFDQFVSAHSLTGQISSNQAVTIGSATGNFRLSAGSPAMDVGVENEVYAIYRQRYGVDTAFDIDRNRRPLSSGWDIGAFEAEGGPVPESPSDLQ